MAAYGSGGGWIKDTLQEQREDQLLKDQRYFDALAAQKKAAAEQQRIQDQRDYEEQQRTDQTALIAQMIMQQNPGLSMKDAVFEAQVMQDKTAAPILQQMRDEQEREQAARDAGWNDFEIQYYRETGKWPPTQKPRTPSTVINTGNVPMTPEQMAESTRQQQIESYYQTQGENFTEDMKLLKEESNKLGKTAKDNRLIASTLLDVPYSGFLREKVYAPVVETLSGAGFGAFDDQSTAINNARAWQFRATNLRVPGSGGMSNFETQGLLNQYANAGNTNFGNYVIWAQAEDDAKRKKAWRDYYNKAYNQHVLQGTGAFPLAQVEEDFVNEYNAENGAQTRENLEAVARKAMWQDMKAKGLAPSPNALNIVDLKGALEYDIPVIGEGYLTPADVSGLKPDKNGIIWTWDADNNASRGFDTNL